MFLPPANEFCEGYVFTPACHSFSSQEGGLYPMGLLHPEGDLHLGGLNPGGWADPPPQSDTAGYSQRAGGTHPTGMRSFCKCNHIFEFWLCWQPNPSCNKQHLIDSTPFIYRMEFDKSTQFCSWNSDQNCTQNSASVTFLSVLNLVPCRYFQSDLF